MVRRLLNKGKITKELIAILSPGRLYLRAMSCCGTRLSPPEETARENLARSIIRATFSQERMQDLDQEGTVVERSEGRRDTQERPGALNGWPRSVHTSRTGESRGCVTRETTASRGTRQKDGRDDALPCILETLRTRNGVQEKWGQADSAR